MYGAKRELGCEGDVEGGGESMWKDKLNNRVGDSFYDHFADRVMLAPLVKHSHPVKFSRSVGC